MKHTKRVLSVCAVLCAFCLLAGLAACGAADDKPYASYNLDKYVNPGEYKGIEAEFETVKEEDVFGYAKEILSYHELSWSVLDDPAKAQAAEGDAVLFSFEGRGEGLSEDTLAGMKSDPEKHHILVLGSGGFIPGFEEQMTGRQRDKKFDVEVVFPEDYWKAELKGMPITFACEIFKIGTETLTDEDVQALDAITGWGFTTAEDFREVLRQDIEQEAAWQNGGIAFDAALANAEFLKTPGKETKYWDKYIKQAAQREGMDSADEYAAQRGYADAKAMRDEELKRDLFAFAVAEKEDIAVTDEELQIVAENMRADSGADGTDDEVFEQLYGSRGHVIRLLMRQKVSEFLFENAKGMEE